MKAKRLFAALLALVMILALAACGETGETEGAGKGDTIRLVNGKIEVDAQLKKLAQMYEEKTGVKVEIESMGGGIDIQGTLKGYYQAGNMPDIFVNGSDADFANWDGLLADMSGEAPPTSTRTAPSASPTPPRPSVWPTTPTSWRSAALTPPPSPPPRPMKRPLPRSTPRRTSWV